MKAKKARGRKYKVKKERRTLNLTFFNKRDKLEQ